MPSRRINLVFSNPAQIRMFKIIFEFEPIAKHPVHGRMAKKDDTRQGQPRNVKPEAQHKDGNAKRLMVEKIVGPCTDTGVYRISQHRKIRQKKTSRIYPPRILQLTEQKDRQEKLSEFFKFYKLVHFSCLLNFKTLTY